MKLASIRLRNFKSHKDTTVDFEPGSNMITGPNYAGKSTILQGIFVGLFGNAGAPGTTQELIRTGATDFTIDLVTTTGLTVTRTSKNSSVARGDAEPFARSHTAVNKAVADELGLDRAAFMKIFASEQGSPQQLLAMEGSELQRFLESCIGIEELDVINKEAGRRRTNHLGQAEALSKFVLSRDDVGNLTIAAENSEKLITRLNDKLRDVSKQLEEGHEAATFMQGEFAKAQESNAAIDRYLAAQAAVDGRVMKTIVDTSDKHKELDALEDKQRLINQAKAVKVIIQGLESDYNLVKARLDSALVKANCVVPDLIDTEAMEAEIDAMIPPELFDTRFIQDQISLINSDVQQLQRRIKIAREAAAASVCPTCSRPFDEGDDTCRREAEVEIATCQEAITGHNAILDQREIELRQANTTNQQREREHQQRVQTLRTTLNSAREANKSSENFRREVDLANQQVQMHQETLTDLEGKILSHKGTLSGLPSVDDAESVQSDVDQLKASIKSFELENAKNEANNQELERLKKDLASLPIPNSLERVPTTHYIDSLNRIQASIKTFNGELNDTKDDIRAAKSHQESIQHKLEAHSKAQVAHEDHLKFAEQYKAISQVLVNNRTRIISESLDAIFAVATEFARACTNGDIEEVLVHKDAISYREKGIIRSKNGASGAQKTIIGLGMKLGLVRLTRTSFDCLLLDEVSADMDPEISMRCALTLGSFCGQSIAVTHRTMDVAGNVITL